MVATGVKYGTGFSATVYGRRARFLALHDDVGAGAEYLAHNSSLVRLFCAALLPLLNKALFDKTSLIARTQMVDVLIDNYMI